MRLANEERIAISSALDILAKLHQQLGDQKIDIAVFPDATRPFPRMVMPEAIRL